MKIFLGADHRGYKLKEKIKEWFADYEIVDMGAYEYNPKDDYTVYAQKVALEVVGGGGMGILICGSGIGVNIVANKFDGIRAGLGKSEKQVSAGRMDDDINVLVLAADYTSESEAKDMVNSFLTTNFSGKLRHKKRIEDIKNIEAVN